MKINRSTKKKLYDFCYSKVNERIQNAQQTMKEAQEAANNETKSSMGDKHETGRALMQIEREKAAKQLSLNMKLMKIVRQIKLDRDNKKATLGSIIMTNSGNFYLSIGVGNAELEEGEFRTISPAASLGSKLMNVTVGKKFVFMGDMFEVTKII